MTFLTNLELGKGDLLVAVLAQVDGGPECVEKFGDDKHIREGVFRHAELEWGRLWKCCRENGSGEQTSQGSIGTPQSTPSCSSNSMSSYVRFSSRARWG